MRKYPEKIISIRKLARKAIPQILMDVPQKSNFILSKFEEKYSEKCDNNFLCKCKNQSGSSPEWKHQVRWAIQDLKYNSLIQYDNGSETYSITKLGKVVLNSAEKYDKMFNV